MNEPVWTGVLETFLNSLDWRECIVGVLVCGSHITGHPDSHSDLDTHLVLKQGISWRERGNRIIDGMLVEYFANPVSQIQEYFSGDMADGRTMSLVQFASGLIVDDDGSVMKLKEQAVSYLSRGFSPAEGNKAALLKYGLWDTIDNVLAAADANRDDLQFLFTVALHEIFATYCRLIGYPVQSAHQIVSVLSDEATQKKYMLPPFPDEWFAEQLLRIMQAPSEVNLGDLQRLAKRVLSYSKDFTIETFSVRSEVSTIGG